MEIYDVYIILLCILQPWDGTHSVGFNLQCHLLLSGYSIFKSFMTDMRPIFDLYSECILYKMYEWTV